MTASIAPLDIGDGNAMRLIGVEMKFIGGSRLYEETSGLLLMALSQRLHMHMLMEDIFLSMVRM